MPFPPQIVCDLRKYTLLGCYVSLQGKGTGVGIPTPYGEEIRGPLKTKELSEDSSLFLCYWITSQ